MKEHIDTIPLHEAFDADTECPFCYLERLSEQRAIRYCIGPGASYMEPDFRGQTDRLGFCRGHMKKLYDYGNALGNALILQTYLAGVLKELDTVDHAAPPKQPLLGKPKEWELLSWLEEKEETCFLCQRLKYNMIRYYHTFFVLLREPEFRQKVESSKGFCLHHFKQLLQAAPKEVPSAQRQWFYETAHRLMRENLLRVKGELDHFVEMFDYRSAGADWGSSRDAVPRTMQKLRGSFPSDPPFKQDT